MYFWLKPKNWCLILSTWWFLIYNKHFHNLPVLLCIALPVNQSSVATPLFFYFQRHRGRRRSSAASNGFPGNANLFLGNTNLPDLVQQSPSPLASPGDASGAQVGGETGPPKTSNPPCLASPRRSRYLDSSSSPRSIIWPQTPPPQVAWRAFKKITKTIKSS